MPAFTRYRAALGVFAAVRCTDSSFPGNAAPGSGSCEGPPTGPTGRAVAAGCGPMRPLAMAGLEWPLEKLLSFVNLLRNRRLTAATMEMRLDLCSRSALLPRERQRTFWDNVFPTLNAFIRPRMPDSCTYKRWATGAAPTTAAALCGGASAQAGLVTKTSNACKVLSAP